MNRSLFFSLASRGFVARLVSIGFGVVVFCACGVAFAAINATTGLPDTKELATDIGLPFSSVRGSQIPLKFAHIIAEVIKYVGVMAMIMMGYGGIKYIISFGKEADTKKALNTLLYAGIGVVVAVAAYALVELVNNFRI